MLLVDSNMSTNSNIRIAKSIRLILAVFHLIAQIEHQFGRAILDILKRQYPDADIDADPKQVGMKAMNVALKQVQRDRDLAMDVLQEFLTYIAVGGVYEQNEGGEYARDKEGNLIPRKTPKPFDFTKGSPTWKDALGNIYSNIRRRAIGRSKKKFDVLQKGQERSVEEAFGKRPEGGGAPEGGEGAIPADIGDMGGGSSPVKYWSSQEEKLAYKQLLETLDLIADDLRDSLPFDQRVLFDLIYEDGAGTFRSDAESIKLNMGQGTIFKEKLEGIASGDGPDADKAAAILKEKAKRWSGYVGTLRNALLKSMDNFFKNELTDYEYDALSSIFFDEPGTKQNVEETTEKLEFAGVEKQRELDERKYGRYLYKLRENPSSIPAKEKKQMDKLKDKLDQQYKELVPGMDEELEGWNNLQENLKNDAIEDLKEQMEEERLKAEEVGRSFDEAKWLSDIEKAESEDYMSPSDKKKYDELLRRRSLFHLSDDIEPIAEETKRQKMKKKSSTLILLTAAQRVADALYFV